MRIIVLLLFMLPHLSSHAEDGYVFGKDYCFYFNAPQGRTLDNVSGKAQGLAMVFYPGQGSWANATTIMNDQHWPASGSSQALL